MKTKRQRIKDVISTFVKDSYVGGRGYDNWQDYKRRLRISRPCMRGQKAINKAISTYFRTKSVAKCLRAAYINYYEVCRWSPPVSLVLVLKARIAKASIKPKRRNAKTTTRRINHRRKRA